MVDGGGAGRRREDDSAHQSTDAAKRRLDREITTVIEGCVALGFARVGSVGIGSRPPEGAIHGTAGPSTVG